MTSAITGVLRDAVNATHEVERHANAIDPRDPTALSVVTELLVDLAGAVRQVALMQAGASVGLRPVREIAVGDEVVATSPQDGLLPPTRGGVTSIETSAHAGHIWVVVRGESRTRAYLLGEQSRDNVEVVNG